MNHPSYHASITPDKPAYQMADSGLALTYRQLDEQSNQGAHAFRSLGINPGDHIAFLLENRLEMMVLIWAAQRSGIIFTPISRYLQRDEVAYIIDDCGAKAFVTSKKYFELAGELKDEISSQVTCLMMGDEVGEFENWFSLLQSMPVTPVTDQCAGAGMLYSSGTTGRPKGILRKVTNPSIDSLSPVLMKVCHELGKLDANSVYLSPAPLYHSAPLAAAMVAGGLGATTIIMPRFDEVEMLNLIQVHRVTHTQVVPTMFVRLVKLPKEIRQSYDVSSLVAALHVAAPCPVEVKREMIDWWGPVLLEYYAGTEGNGVTAALSHEWLENPGTVGRALYGSVRILDDDGEELPNGEVGDVYFDTEFKFSYHNDPEKTAGSTSKQGWTTLGDVGWKNDAGYLFLTDRRSYTIISGGVNIYPQETEDLMVTHPAVADVAVFGVPNEELGEEVKAVVQPANPVGDEAALEAELIAFCRSKLSVIKSPKSIDFRDELPRTPTGKLIKRHLKDEYWPSKTENKK